MRFMIKDGGVNAAVFIAFLQRLVAGAKRTIFLSVDRGPAHRAKKTVAFVETLGGKLRLFFLPSNWPDRKLDEWVWKHLKAIPSTAWPSLARMISSAMSVHPCANCKMIPTKSAPSIRIRPERFHDFSTLHDKSDVIPAKA